MPVVNHTLDLARAITTALSTGNTGALVTDVYREAAPASRSYPFVKVGVILDDPVGGWCYDGIDADFAISVFHKAKTSEALYNILFAIQQDLLNQELPLDGGGIVHSIKQAGRSQVLQDDEKDKWRGIIQFNALTSQ